jgi:hypothetical protein
MEGSALVRVKTALLVALKAQDVRFRYASPAKPEDMLSDDGSGVAGWFADDAPGTFTVPSMLGGGEVWFDETRTIILRIQSLGKNSDYTQKKVDTLATELLGAAMYVFCTNPDADVTSDDDIVVREVLPTGDASPWTGGLLPSGMRAAGWEIAVQYSARIKLGTQ